MKPSISIATIICGTVLLIVPYVSNAIGTVAVATTVAHLNKEFNLTGHMPDWYDGACFALGLVMVLVGIAAAFRRPA